MAHDAHSCARTRITALHDAGRVREQIRAITGHTIASISAVLDRYTRLTADQAVPALERRLAHETGTVWKLFDRSTAINEGRTKR